MAYHYFSDQTSNTAVTPNFIINAEHKPGHYNVLADSLSFPLSGIQRPTPRSECGSHTEPTLSKLRLD